MYRYSAKEGGGTVCVFASLKLARANGATVGHTIRGLSEQAHLLTLAVVKLSDARLVYERKLGNVMGQCQDQIAILHCT